VAASRSVTPQINLFINNRAATPGFTQYSYTTDLLYPSRYVKVGDYDGDGKPDIAAAMRGLGAFAIDVYKNRNCHQPKILNGSEVRICTGQSVTLEAVPMPGVAFSWSTGATGPTATVTSANAGTVTLTATGEGGACSVQTSITVIGGDGAAPAKPTISGPDGVCAGSSIILTTASVAGSPTYIWTGPNNFTVETSTPSVTVTSNANLSYSGSYQLTVKVNNCLSTASDPKTVTVVEPSSFSISGNSGVCSGQSVTLSVTPVEGYTYQWKKGGSNIAGATGPSYTINPVSVSDGGSYTVNIAHQTVLNCSQETSPFALQVLTAPVAVISSTPPLNQVCVGTEVTFSASGSTVDNAATVTYAWDFGNGATGSGATASHIYQTARVSTIASLTISYSGSGCSSNASTTSFPVSAAIAPVITAEPQVAEICGNGSESVTLTVAGSYESYTWSTNATGESLVVKTPGTYRVNTLDANACADTAEIVLASKPGCEAGSVPAIEITVPKVFTPNDDGSNDFWLIEGLEEYPDCLMSVFDGRGRRVFEAAGSMLMNNPWDGRAAGGPVPDGTYFFVFGCPNGARATGSVLIIR
jgi:gliding motility-associated-like protein